MFAKIGSIPSYLVLEEMLAEQEELNIDIQQVLDAQTDVWGIKVSNVEIKHVDLDESVVRAIARQAEAEREWRAKRPNAFDRPRRLAKVRARHISPNRARRHLQ